MPCARLAAIIVTLARWVDGGFGAAWSYARQVVGVAVLRTPTAGIKA